MPAKTSSPCVLSLSSVIISGKDHTENGIGKDVGGRRDTYMLLSWHMVRGIKKHLVLNNPATYLFEHPLRKAMPMSTTTIRNKLKGAIEKTGIKKDVCVHTFRHTYATHQLEAGQNIVAVKEALRHSRIETTLMYLHIAKTGPDNRFGCRQAL